MINLIIEAVGIALREEFGESYEIYMKELEQGLKGPCFFISCQNSANEPLRGQRYFRRNQLRIRYFPESGEIQPECNDIAERMRQCLEYVTVDGGNRPIRGTKMNYEVIDGVLNFSVNYDYFVCIRKEETPAMGGLTSDTTAKGGD